MQQQHEFTQSRESNTLRKKGLIGVLYMKHRLLFTPKNLLC